MGGTLGVSGYFSDFCSRDFLKIKVMVGGSFYDVGWFLIGEIFEIEVKLFLFDESFYRGTFQDFGQTFNIWGAFLDQGCGGAYQYRGHLDLGVTFKDRG